MKPTPYFRRFPYVIFLLFFVACWLPRAQESETTWIDLTLRKRVESKPASGEFKVEHYKVRWDARKTAVVICDMWQKHWCASATRRGGEMAPRMNEVAGKLRDKGVLVIHAPSSAMKLYADTPQRLLAKNAPVVEAKVTLQKWCHLDKDREAPLPIDDSDGGCDCQPLCKYTGPESMDINQNSVIEIAAEDAITDSAEAYYLMRARGIEHVLVMGVHTNMCILGRPFSIRQLVYQDLDVVLLRDLTDTMYNPRMSPFVSHVAGTDLVVEHIEKYWAATTTSTAITGKPRQRFSEDRRSDEKKIGRPVRIVSISFNPKQQSAADIIATVDREAARGTDLIVLPETWTGQNDSSTETLQGPTIAKLAALAAKHATYIVCPIDRRTEECRLNSAVVIDRMGKVSGIYDKVYPFWSEFDHKDPVAPGQTAPVFETDFGKVGMAICFDVNFPEVWQRLDDNGAELVLWPSAYSAGRHLQAYALLHHYYIVTSSYRGDCQVYDITGERIRDHHNSGNFDRNTAEINVARVTLDLDRCIFHSNYNRGKRDQLLKDHGDKVEQEQFLKRESWFVLKATQPGASARALTKEYGMEELRDYILRSRREIDRMRGYPFSGPAVSKVSGSTATAGP